MTSAKNKVGRTMTNMFVLSDVSLASLGPGDARLAWGRSRSVPERWSDCQLTGGGSHQQHHGGSYLLRPRPPLARLGRQFSVSSDYVSANNGGVSGLYEPSYNYPSFHGISDSLLATVGEAGTGPGGQRQYLDSDYFSLHLQPGRDTETNFRPERRKKTVRFNSVSDREFYQGEGGLGGLDYGWMTIQDLRPGVARVRHSLWDRQESQDSTARSVGLGKFCHNQTKN